MIPVVVLAVPCASETTKELWMEGVGDKANRRGLILFLSSPRPVDIHLFQLHPCIMFKHQTGPRYVLCPPAPGYSPVLSQNYTRALPQVVLLYVSCTDLRAETFPLAWACYPNTLAFACKPQSDRAVSHRGSVMLYFPLISVAWITQQLAWQPRAKPTGC